MLVTGSREPLSVTLLRSIVKAINGVRTTAPVPHILSSIEQLLESAIDRELLNEDVTGAIDAAADYATRTGKHLGLLIVLDKVRQVTQIFCSASRVPRCLPSAIAGGDRGEKRRSAYLRCRALASGLQRVRRESYSVGIVGEGYGTF